MAGTRSPPRKPPASARTSPATSQPGVNGSSGRIWYSPRVCSTSGKTTPAYSTSTSTWSCVGVGSGTSWISTASGPVRAVITAARTVHSCVRTRLITRSSGQPAGHGHDHRDVDHRLGVLGQGLVVADAATVLADPGQGGFDHPAAWDEVEAGEVVGALDDRDGAGQHCPRPADQAAGVAAVGPDQGDGGELRAECGQQPDRAIAVLQTGDGDDHGQ